MDVFENLEKELQPYINEIKYKTNTEAKIVHLFTSFIEKVFKIDVKDIGYEDFVKSNIKEVSGRMDTVIGDIIIEFKKSLKSIRALDEATVELVKYFQAAYENEPESKKLGIITDGLIFKVYRAEIEDKKEVKKIVLINEIDISTKSTEFVFNWFDSFFFLESKTIPTSDNLKQMFGIISPQFGVTKIELIELYEKVKNNTRTKIKYDNWARFIEIVYGTRPDKIDLFITHTYLSTFAKLIVYLKLQKSNRFGNYDIPPILWGNVFTQLGIRNFVEDDFFTWTMSVSIRKQSSKIFEDMLRKLEKFDLDKLDEDVLKELYQDMVRPESRKQLGEFYTPDWLAEKIVIETLSDNSKKSVLDPSCGSGTFLFKTISYKIQKLQAENMPDSEILSHILDNVIGMDIHPLASIIAKTNYILALKKIIKNRNGPITIPVYLSDSIKIPQKKIEVINSISTFEFDTEILNKKFAFPASFSEDIKKMDEIIETMKEYGHDLDNTLEQTAGWKNFDVKETVTNLIKRFEGSLSKIKNENEKQILIKNIQTLFELIQKDSDSIWPYILRNMYRPIPLTEKKVDAIIGNPPWVPMKEMKNVNYQEFLKNESKKYDLIDTKKTQSIPHIELATLFFCKVSEIYLKKSGTISFVMPKSILIASHHEKFRTFSHPPMKLMKVYDLEKVQPLFRIISCVIFAKKEGNTSYPVEQVILKGKLEKFNEQLIEAKTKLSEEKTEYEPAIVSTNQSYYYKKFVDGATIYPRCFYYVNIKSGGVLGFDPNSPTIKSEINSNAKNPWNITCEGKVPKEFLFNSILGTDLIPFGTLKTKITFLPITYNENKISLFENHEDKNIVNDLKIYLKNIEDMWNQNRTGKNEKYSVYEYLNWHNKLVVQNPFAKFKVAYTASGSNIACSVIEPNRNVKYQIDGQELNLKGMFVDLTCFYCDFNDEDEAHYICAFLNSKEINELIKPFQAKGMFGPRHIYSWPLTFPIEKFNKKDSRHLKLSEISKKCHIKSQEFSKNNKFRSVGKIRGEIRKSLENELEEIDQIVKELLNMQ